MGSPLGQVLAATFMVELERNLIPVLKDHLSCWKRYVDDTFCFVRNGSVEHMLPVQNNFHSSIKFAYETEKCNRRTGENIETCVFSKSTNTDVYIDWNSFAPLQWKHSTLKTLVYREYFFLFR